MSASSLTRRLVGGVALSLLLGGCATSGLSFVQDDRVTITAPKANTTLKLPFTLRWTSDDVSGTFAVFFDRSPMRPEQTLRDLVSDDDPCNTTTECPDAQWLADRQIYVTSGPTLRVETLPDRRDSARGKDRHDVTIVILDDRGRRAGESAFTREFIVERAE